MVERMVQDVIQVQFDEHIGASPYERTRSRRGVRNGYKPRTFKTRAGTLELRIPQDRHGRFQPSLFERYERSEKALIAALVQMYVQGVSTRKVSKIVEQLCGHMISASAVSALTKKLDEEVAAWRRRSLASKRYRYLIVDAHYEQVRREGSVRSTAVLWVVGIDENGFREHLGLWTGSAESLESWGAVFRDLVDRGVAGVEMIVSDEHLGLVQALKRSPGPAPTRPSDVPGCRGRQTRATGRFQHQRSSAGCLASRPRRAQRTSHDRESSHARR